MTLNLRPLPVEQRIADAEETASDGRIGWPSIVQYRIAAGPDKGMYLACPPTAASHPHPTMGLASAPFAVIVHDHEAYEHLARSGALYRPEHTGGAGGIVDNRKAPGA